MPRKPIPDLGHDKLDVKDLIHKILCRKNGTLFGERPGSWSVEKLT